jgi:peroxiredoxin
MPYALLAPNRQYAIYAKARQITAAHEPDWRKETRQYESLLPLGPHPALKKFIDGLLFDSARKADEVEAMIKYGEQVYTLDPADTALFARIAIVMANKKMDLPKALDYARRVETAFAEFRPMKCPPDIPASDFESNFSLEKQQENYRRQQALALDAVGWVLSQMGQATEAEAKLRRSVELNRVEASLTHLTATLKQLGQTEEAEKIEVELNAKLEASVKSQLINRPAKDFQLTATDGRKYRLSELKGKVVLVSTWATWCGPCVAEMPLFVKAYEKYKDRGFEILAISDDEPAVRDYVLRFAKEHHLNFPVLYDEEVVAKLYDLQGYPGNIFIDRQGNVRYSLVGGFDDARRLEIILNELLK